MAGRCLNKVMLIGNLTRDPELRYTPAGTAVATFGLATNRRWKTQNGEFKDEAQFHRIVAWNRLAELCSQLLVKGTRIYIEGRLQYREWLGNDETKHQTTEIIAEDMIVLGRGKGEGEESLEKAAEVDFEEISSEGGEINQPLAGPELEDKKAGDKNTTEETEAISSDFEADQQKDQDKAKAKSEEDKEEIPF